MGITKRDMVFNDFLESASSIRARVTHSLIAIHWIKNRTLPQTQFIGYLVVIPPHGDLNHLAGIKTLDGLDDFVE